MSLADSRTADDTATITADQTDDERREMMSSSFRAAVIAALDHPDGQATVIAIVAGALRRPEIREALRAAVALESSKGGPPRQLEDALRPLLAPAAAPSPSTPMDRTGPGA